MTTHTLPQPALHKKAGILSLVFGLLFVLAGFVSSPLASAQSTTATIAGTVTDPSGAVLVGAKVVATNTDTKVTHEDVTGKGGQFSIPLLLPGSYKLSATMQGFKTQVKSGIVLQLEQQARIDLTLVPGATGEDIVVTGSAPLTDTDSAAVGSVVDNEKISEMPLNGRNYYTLAYIVPGANQAQATGIVHGGFGVAGSNEASDYYTLDGFNNTNSAVAGTVISPNVDSILEFKILLGTTEAEFGHNTGAQVVVVSKSGTNHFHGSAFEFVRNSALDAKGFFQAPGTSVDFSRNQFGGTVGGPIRKDKTFFFAAYEQLLSNQPVVALQTIPTPQMIAGNFSAYPSITIHAPTGYSSAAVTGGKVINTAAFTPSQLTAYNIAQALLAYYPTPTSNNVNAAGIPTNNYNLNDANVVNERFWDLRLDHTISSSDSLFASLHYLDESNLNATTNFLPVFEPNSPVFAGLYGIGYNHIFTPNLINQARAGFNRYNNINVPLSNNIPFDQTYGIPASNKPIGSVPVSSITGYQGLGSSAGYPQDRVFNTWSYADTLLWNIGRHNAKFGAEYHRFQDNNTIQSSGPGVLAFTGPLSGYSVADAVFGLPHTASSTPNTQPLAFRSSYVAAYLQDEFKISKNLTITYGLRWEEFTPMTDAHNNLEKFNYALASTAAAAQPVGVNGVPRYLYSINNADFGPRFGISWQPTGSPKLVIRAGYGMNYDFPAVGNQGLQSAGTGYPIRITSTSTSTATNVLSLPNPFVGAVTPGTVPGVLNTTAVQQNFQLQRTETMSLGFQYQLSRTTVLDVSYLGSLGQHITDVGNGNQGSLATSGAGVVYPYPFWTYILQVNSEGASNYNGLLVKLDRRFRNGFSYLVGYTYAKSLDDSSGSDAGSNASIRFPQDSHNLRGEYGLSDYDTRHRLVISPVYELPFGRGKAFLANGLPSKIIGGFELAGIVTFQTGTPYTPTVGSATCCSFTNIQLNAAGGYDRPNVVPGQNPNHGPKTVTSWINTAGLSIPALGTFGNARRNGLIGPGYNDTDVNISRNVKLPHELSLQFRAELFNLFNHPNFGLPNAVVTSNAYNTITSINGNSRDVQFGVKILF